MKKVIALGLTSLMIATSFVGCKSTSSSEYLLDIKYSDYVELSSYEGVEATKIVFDVTDEDVLEEIEYNLYDYATYDPVTNRGVEVGDYANITYTTTIDGKVNDNYSGEEEDVLVGEGYSYPELEDALIGMKAGETAKVEVELTEDYAEEELVGKKATIDVTLNEITVENIPEYNEEFVKENTEFETMKEYEKSVKESLIASKEEEYMYVAIEEIFADILKNSKFDGYPDELYAQCEEMYDQNNAYYASMYGFELEEYMEMFGIDEETREEDIKENVHYELVIGAIAQAEGIDCTEKEINEYVDEIFLDYGYESAEAFLEDYTMQEIGYELIYQKVSEFLYEKAKFVELSEEDYLSEQQADYFDVEESDAELQEEFQGELESLDDLDDTLDVEVEEATEETTDEATEE